MTKETSTHPCIVKVNSIDWTGIEIDYPPLTTRSIAIVQSKSALTAAISLILRTSSHKIKLGCGRGRGWWASAGDEIETFPKTQFLTASSIAVVKIHSAPTAAISFCIRAWRKSADPRACSTAYIL
jgi:hypothetical protein